MKWIGKYEAFLMLILALITTFFGVRAIITQEASGFITGVATPAVSTPYYGKDAIIIGIALLIVAALLFWWTYKKLL